MAEGFKKKKTNNKQETFDNAVCHALSGCMSCMKHVHCFLVYFFFSRVGGWEKLSRPVGVETGSVGGQAMDLMIHAAAFGLGMKKSAVKFPWEREPVNPVFFKRPRLIAPPVFVPKTVPADDAISIPVAEAEGRLKWSRKTLLVPWPVAQDRALAKVLESWRLIIMDDYKVLWWDVKLLEQ